VVGCYLWIDLGVHLYAAPAKVGVIAPGDESDTPKKQKVTSEVTIGVNDTILG
jgi:hypothetical protein